MIGHGINDFYNIQDAVPDADGLIEAVLLPLVDLVVFPNMVTPLLIRREQDIAAIGEAQTHQETVSGVAQRNPSPDVLEPDDLYTIRYGNGAGTADAHAEWRDECAGPGPPPRRNRGDSSRQQPYFRVKARPLAEQCAGKPRSNGADAGHAQPVSEMCRA